MELIFRVRAEYEQLEKCKKEMKEIEEQLQALDANATPKEIERLTKRYAQLSAQWENGMSRIGKLGYYTKEAFGKLKDVLKSSNDELEKTEDTNSDIYSKLVSRLKLEERISEELKKQKDEAARKVNNAVEGYNRNAAIYSEKEEGFRKKYNGQTEEFWSKEDQAVMERGRDALKKWEKELDDRRVQFDTFSDLLDASQKRAEDYKKKLSDIELPKLDVKSVISDLEQQVDAGNKSIDELKEKLAKLKEELASRQEGENGFSQYFQDAKDEMYKLYDEIKTKKAEIDNLKKSDEGFMMSGAMTNEIPLDVNLDELIAKISEEEKVIKSLKEQQSGLNEGTAMYKSLQDEIDLHIEEKKKNEEILGSTKKTIEESNVASKDEIKAHIERQDKIRSLSAEVDTLTEKYEKQKAIANDSSSNEEAIKRIGNEIENTQAKIDATTDSTKALNDVLNNLKESASEGKIGEFTYTGFASSDPDGPKSARVFRNEDDYNRRSELANQEKDLQNQITTGVQNGSLSVEELERLQTKLKDVQDEMGEFDAKARQTAEALGQNLASKAQAATERLYELNRSIDEQTAKYKDLEMQLNSMQSLLEFQEKNGTPQQIAETKARVDELRGSLNDVGDTLSKLKSEQTDAKSAVNGLASQMDLLESSIVKAVGGIDNFNEILSHMPLSIQGVIKGILGMKNAAMSFLATPVGITIMAIAAALYAVKKALDVVFLWFNKSAEGQRAYAKIAGYLQGVLIRLEEIFVKLGGTIFKVSKKIVEYIAQPKKAFKAILDFIGDQIKNRLKGFIDAFVGFGETIANVFVDMWESIKNGELSFDKTRKSAKKVLDGILAIGTGVSNVTDKIGNAVDATVNWFEKTHDVAKESSKIAAEERELGLEIESNKKKTLELQKSMAQLQATMRDTNKSKAERDAALKEYKKQLEQQTKIQTEFAKKRRDLQQRKMDLDEPDTIEEQEQLERLNNEVLSAEVSQQRALTALQRITNSINKKASGKTKEQLEAEYKLLLDDQAQKQAEQIRQNGYIIEQARINAMTEGTERTIAQMRLDFKKEMDAAVLYEDNLKREKLKLARARFQKDPKNKGKVFGPTTVDVSMTEQEVQVSQSKVNDATNKYNQHIENMFKSYETFAEKRRRRESDYNALIELNSNLQREKAEELVSLTQQLGSADKEEEKAISEKIALLDQEIDALEDKAKIIKANNELNNEELSSMRNYLKEYGTFQQQKLAIAQEYALKIKKAQAEGNTGEVLRLQKEQDTAFGDAKAKELARNIDFTQMLDGVGTIVKEIARQTYDKLQEYKGKDEYKNSSAENKKAIADLEAKLVEKGGAGYASPFNTKTWNNITAAADKFKKALDELDKKTAEHTQAIEEQKLANEAFTNATSVAAKEMLRGKLDEANKKVESTGEAQQQAESQVVEAQGEVTTATTQAAQGLNEFNAAISQITSGSLSGFANGISSLIGQLTGKGAQDITGLLGEKVGGIIGAIIGLIDALGDNPGQFLEDLVDKIFALINGFLDQLFSGELVGKLVEAIVKGVTQLIGNIVGQIGNGGGFGMVFNTIKGVFGGFVDGISKGLGFTENTSAEVDAAIEQSNTILDSIDKNVERISEKMEKSYGASAIAEQRELLRQYQMKTGQYNAQVQAAGWGKYDSSHSEWYFRNANGGEGVGGYVDRIRHLLGMEQGGYGTAWQGFFNQLSDMGIEGAEKLALLRENAERYGGEWAELWHQIDERGWDDEGRIATAANSWADLAKAVEDTKDKLEEILLTTNFDNVFDDMLDNLYNYADGAEDVMENIAENWQKMVNKMVINNLLAEDLQKQLEPLFETWSSAVYKANNETDTKKKQEMLDDANKDFYDGYIGIYESGMDLIDNLKAAGIIQSTNASSYKQQKASANSIENISYDQADSLIGIEMAKQILLEQMLQILKGFSGEVSISGVTVESGDTFAMVKELQLTNSKLDTIIQQMSGINVGDFGSLDALAEQMRGIFSNSGVNELTPVLNSLLGNIQSMTNENRNNYIDEMIKKKFLNESNTSFCGFKDLEDIFKAATSTGAWGGEKAKQILDGYDLSSFERLLEQLNSEFGGQYDALYGSMRNASQSAEITLLTAKADNIIYISSEHRDIAADSRDILAGMAIHVEEIRDGVVDTIVPRIKNIDSELTKVRKIVEAQ